MQKTSWASVRGDSCKVTPEGPYGAPQQSLSCNSVRIQMFLVLYEEGLQTTLQKGQTDLHSGNNSSDFQARNPHHRLWHPCLKRSFRSWSKSCHIAQLQAPASQPSSGWNRVQLFSRSSNKSHSEILWPSLRFLHFLRFTFFGLTLQWPLLWLWLRFWILSLLWLWPRFWRSHLRRVLHTPHNSVCVEVVKPKWLKFATIMGL